MDYWIFMYVAFCMHYIYIYIYYTHGTSVCSLIQSTFVESAQSLTIEKSQGAHITVTHPFGDHTQSCLTLAFKSEYSSYLSTHTVYQYKIQFFSHYFWGDMAILGNGYRKT